MIKYIVLASVFACACGNAPMDSAGNPSPNSLGTGGTPGTGGASDQGTGGITDQGTGGTTSQENTGGTPNATGGAPNSTGGTPSTGGSVSTGGSDTSTGGNAPVDSGTSTGGNPSVDAGNPSDSGPDGYVPDTYSPPPVCVPATCVLTQGYWKNHPELWANQSLTLGGVTYTAQQCMDLLNLSSYSDGSVILAKQLIAALLNGGACDPNISATVQISQDWLTANKDADGTIPYGTLCIVPTDLGCTGVSLGSVLDNYNSGRAGTPSCN